MKPKPLVALNHFTVPMLTGVVPSQDRYSRSPSFDGLVRSNFWKGRQRLNRLYRWIANVVRPKIDGLYYANAAPKTILTCDFLVPRRSGPGGRPEGFRRARKASAGRDLGSRPRELTGGGI